MKKKGQVALEFLMTYGWAFLVILVVIGAFVYFDVLNPQTRMSGRCTFAAGMYCAAYAITPDNVSIEIRNDLGRSITLKDASITGSLGGTPDALDCDVGEDSLARGANKIITCGFLGDKPESGEIYQATIIIRYTASGTSLTQTMTGSITGLVVEPLQQSGNGGGGGDMGSMFP